MKGNGWAGLLFLEVLQIGWERDRRLKARQTPKQKHNQADRFVKSGRALRRRMWWNNCKMKVVVAGVAVMVLFIIVLLICFSAGGEEVWLRFWMIVLAVQCGGGGGGFSVLRGRRVAVGLPATSHVPVRTESPSNSANPTPRHSLHPQEGGRHHHPPPVHRARQPRHQPLRWNDRPGPQRRPLSLHRRPPSLL